MEQKPQQLRGEAPGAPSPPVRMSPANDQEQGPGTPTEAEPEIRPRIYVASLSDYNDGRLHGTWIDADQDPEAIGDAIQGMLLASPMGRAAEEWAIHDFEGFNGLHLGEWENLEHVSRVAKGITEHGLAFAHWTMLAAADDELDKFEDAYLGHWPSITAYAADYLEDSGVERALERVVPDSLQPYVKVDAEALGRDLELGGDVSSFEGDGGVYLFRSDW